MSTVLITGGSGMIGKALTKMLLASGYKVIVLTRKISNTKLKKTDVDYALWDINKQTLDISALQRADFILHLAGANLFSKRWTTAYKKEIIDSRVNSASLIVKMLRNTHNKIKAIVSASAIGWYGADENSNTPFVESDKPDEGFLGQTCKRWEESIMPAEALGIRIVKYRIGIVMSNKGGALMEFKKPLQFGIAGILGSGKQMISWVHIEDLCRLFIHALENETMTGSFNAVAPHPVSNKELVLTLARNIRGKFYIPLHIPSFLLKLILGEKGTAILEGTTVSSKKIEETGFEFQFPVIKAAVSNLFNTKK